MDWAGSLFIDISNFLSFFTLKIQLLYFVFRQITHLLFMSNIFLQLTKFDFNQEVLQNFTGASSNKQLQRAIDGFFESGKSQFSDYANFLIDLLPLITSKPGKQKILISLVYFIVKTDEDNGQKCLLRILQSSQPVFSKVKFFSYVFKSISSLNLKKWIIKNTVIAIQQEEKISTYAGIIEHFDQMIQILHLTQEESFQIYYRLVSYLEKHPVYKKLCSVYIIKALQNVTESNAQNPQARNLILKVIKSGAISDQALSLLNHKHLQKNELFPILEVLLTGDYEKLNLENIGKLQKQGLVGQEVLRKMKIEAIPRLLSNVKIASYDQVAERLSIKKSEVGGYIIDAIKQGVIKAKLDEFEETVIINRLNFRALRMQERAKLQKDISDFIETLSGNLKNIE